MRFFVTFIYQDLIFEEAFDAADWSKAYQEARQYIPVQAVTLGIHSTSNASSKTSDDRKQSTVFYNV